MIAFARRTMASRLAGSLASASTSGVSAGSASSSRTSASFWAERPAIAHFTWPPTPRFADWFAGRGWSPRAHQLAMVQKAREDRDALLIAPTGGGKTLAGFLPSLIALSERPPSNAPRGLHTLYISPLKALAVDV